MVCMALLRRIRRMRVDADDERESQGLDDEGHGLGDEDHGLDDEGHGLDDEDHGLDDEISPSSPVVPSPIALPVATPTTTISRLDALPPTLIANIDKDVREMYTRSGAVRDEIFSQRLWAGHVDTRLADMSQARYDDHRLIHDMLVQQAAM
ncbi:hypothetical protein Tco_0884379 [Tanacetum coccineum]